MRLLVTGGAGYIGSAVAAQLVTAGHDVTVVDDLSTGHADAVPSAAQFVEGSLLDDEALGRLLARGFDGVLHFAARSLVGESVQEPALYWRNNVCGSLNLLEAIQAAGVPRLVFSSTAAVYGEPEIVPIPETAPTAPTSPYGASKLAVDSMIGAFAARYGLAAVSLRYFNVAGAVGACGERHPVETHLIPLALEVALGTRDHLAVYGTDYPTPDGTAVRDYIHLDDLVRAHLLAIEAAEPRRHIVCNLGNGRGYSVREVVTVARRVTGHPIPTVDEPRRPGDPAVLVASADRAAEELGWSPARPSLSEIVGDAWSFASSRAPSLT